MRPSGFADNAHRKIRLLKGALPGIVVRDSGNATNQIANRSPEKPDSSRNCAMLPNGRGVRMMNRARPFRGVRPGTFTQAREQCELEMIVRIDQARKDQVSGNVQ